MAALAKVSYLSGSNLTVLLLVPKHNQHLMACLGILLRCSCIALVVHLKGVQGLHEQ